MSEKNWMGIEGLTYKYYNEWADPTITYKGQTFSEWEVADSVQHWIDDGIASGDIEPGTTMESYLADPSNHQVVTGILDDFIYNLIEATREELSEDIEQFMFERGEYDFKGSVTIRWIDNQVKPELIRRDTTERIKADLQNDSKALLLYLSEESYVMDDEDELSNVAEHLIEKIEELDKMQRQTEEKPKKTRSESEIEK